MSSVTTAVGLVSLGMRLVLVMIPYSPLSLAVASNLRFHDIQLSCPSLGLMSLNLWMSCFGGDEVGCCVMDGSCKGNPC